MFFRFCWSINDGRSDETKTLAEGHSLDYILKSVNRDLVHSLKFSAPLSCAGEREAETFLGSRKM
jgi:hypothetical protein